MTDGRPSRSSTEPPDTDAESRDLMDGANEGS
jgi:hypothetical protein